MTYIKTIEFVAGCWTIKRRCGENKRNGNWRC